MTESIHGGNVWQGEDPSQWLDYSANIRPEGAPDWVKKALRSAIKNISYYPATDMHRARKGLAEYLELPEEFVQPSSGGASAIELATRCGKKRVMLCSPCFGEYRASAEKNGLPVESICLLDGARRIVSPAEALEDELGSDMLVWLCSPMNPTGHSFSRQEILDLLALARRKNCRVALDEAFIDFCPGASRRELVKDWPELIVVGSLTKILGIPGVRLGYLCAQDALSLGKNCIPWELNCFAEEAAIQLPAHRQEILEDAKECLQRTKTFSEGLESLGLYVYPSQSNFVLVDLCIDADPVIEALKEKKILVRRCMDFEGIDDGRHVRLAVKDERSNQKFLNTLKEILTCAENR
jgi:histidinol-phosphate/aromatic aminotransferase/cobyric acid decarboxylase-like protein